MTDVMAVLERARHFEIEISAQLEHIERLHRIVARAGHSHSYSVKMIEKLEKLEREVNHQIDRTVDAKLEALEYISILDGEERGVIESYFILGKTWEQIADKMYMSDRRVFLIRKKALSKLNKHFGNLDRRQYGYWNEDTRASGACTDNAGGACQENRRNDFCGRQL